MRQLALPEDFGVLYACPAGETEREQHFAAYTMLQEVLRRHAGLPELPEIARTEMGKPWFPAHPEIRFSISHTKGLAVCLLSDKECGVDTEQRRPLREKVAARVFSPEEQAALAASDDPDMLFTRLWTLKESYVKAIGIGVSYPMREISFTLGDTVQSNRTDAAFFHMTVEDHAVSVCCLCDAGHAAI
ncbi:MAG: 4'-phosphopantetheinyl transferase superfamily protein [Oscillospiraceae bacterium]|nr:4'-phosphopantetheinyl transferase superfamily protein [Oscillospiraceae bacterium]